MKGLRRCSFNFVTLTNNECFYLVTWMKGLRHIVDVFRFLVQTRRFLPCDLNEGITTVLCSRGYPRVLGDQFLPCDLNEGITTSLLGCYSPYKIQRVFTLWPEWRDYDLSILVIISIIISLSFYLVTWMKGLRQIKGGDITAFMPRSFYLVTWMKGLRRA